MASWWNSPEIIGFHGSGILARRDERVYLITARHCVGSANASLAEVAARLVIPYRIWKGRSVHSEDLLRFTELFTTRLQSRTEDVPGDLDIAVLLVQPQSDRVLKHIKGRAVKLPPTGEFFRALWEKAGASFGKIQLVALGYPKLGETYVDYSSGRMSQQRARLYGRMVGPGPYLHSMRFNLMEDSPVLNPHGMSGGPVILRYRRGGALKYVLVGMSAWGGHGNISFVTVDWLTYVVNQAEGRITPPPDPFF